MARRRPPKEPPPHLWPDRLSLVNEVCRRLRAGQDIGYIVTVCRCTLRMVLDLRRANERADAIRKRWRIGLYRTLDQKTERRILPADIDAAAGSPRARRFARISTTVRRRSK